MTNNTGKQKKYKVNFKHLNKNGSRLHRRDAIETSYIKGVRNADGELVIRPLNEEEISFLNNYYKEFVHGTFNTDEESMELFKNVKKELKKKKNIEHYAEHNCHSESVKKVVSKFNEKSKDLGNIAYDFWTQREINSDDYKKRCDIQNNAIKGVQLESFEDLQYISKEEDVTIIEDLITESEE